MFFKKGVSFSPLPLVSLLKKIRVIDRSGRRKKKRDSNEKREKSSHKGFSLGYHQIFFLLLLLVPRERL